MSRLPDFLTVEEAAAIVRIGRTLAYQEAARFEATRGAEGLPVIRIGRLLRVPRARLEALVGGPLTCLPVNRASADSDEGDVGTPTTPRHQRPASRRKSEREVPPPRPQRNTAPDSNLTPRPPISSRTRTASDQLDLFPPLTAP